MHKNLQRALLVRVFVAAVALAFTYRNQIDVKMVADQAARAGLARPMPFMALYAMATELFLPWSVLTLAGGALLRLGLGPNQSDMHAVRGGMTAWLEQGGPAERSPEHTESP